MDNIRKGEYLGQCNLSSCTSGLPADYYNHGSLKHYCKPCALRLNADPYNKRDAQKLFGHELCTEVIPPHMQEPLEPNRL